MARKKRDKTTKGDDAVNADTTLAEADNLVSVSPVLQPADNPSTAAPQFSWKPIFRNWRDIVAVLGTVGTIFFGLLSLYFYQAAKIAPLLTFSVHPLKTELQRPDFDKELGFSYKGAPIKSESITSVQMSIWNAGTQPIRDSSVLDPVRIVMPDGAAILSARVKKSSREICDIHTIDNKEDYKVGICHLKWRILEPGDGAILQVIYAGDAQHDPTLEGTVEGQSDGIVVEKYALNNETKKLSPTTFRTSQFVPFAILVVISASLFYLGFKIETGTEAAKQLSDERKAAKRRIEELNKIAARSKMRPIALLIWLVAILFLFLAAAWLYWSSAVGPPFGW